jgi:hypothetical protein
MIKKPINSIKNANLGKWARIITSSALFLLSSLSMAGARESSPQAAETKQSKIKLTGLVVDTSGEPAIGANVQEKGAGTGTVTVTDVDGTFTLDVLPGATLTVSFIGYNTQETVIDVPIGHLTDPVHTSPGSRRMHPGHQEYPAGRPLDIFRLLETSRWAVAGHLPVIGNASSDNLRTLPGHREYPTGRSPDISRAFTSRSLQDGASCTSFIINYNINRL